MKKALLLAAVSMAVVMGVMPAEADIVAQVIFGFDHLGGRVSETPLDGISVEVVDLGELKKLTARLKGGEARLLVWYLDNPAELCVSLEGDANQAVKVRLVFSNRTLSFGKISFREGVALECRTIPSSWVRKAQFDPAEGPIPPGGKLNFTAEVLITGDAVVEFYAASLGQKVGGLQVLPRSTALSGSGWMKVLFTMSLHSSATQNMTFPEFVLEGKGTGLGKVTFPGREFQK